MDRRTDKAAYSRVHATKNGSTFPKLTKKKGNPNFSKNSQKSKCLFDLIIMIIMPLAWSQCVRNGHHAFGRDTVPLAGSIPLACMHGDHAFGIITMPLTSSPRLWHGHRAFGMVTASLAWLPRLWHGHRALDMITATEAMVIHDFAVVYDSLLILFSKSAVFFCSLA